MEIQPRHGGREYRPLSDCVSCKLFPTMLVFIDESGCPGFKFTRGCDPVFGIGMVIFANGDDARITEQTMLTLPTSAKQRRQLLQLLREDAHGTRRWGAPGSKRAHRRQWQSGISTHSGRISAPRTRSANQGRENVRFGARSTDATRGHVHRCDHSCGARPRKRKPLAGDVGTTHRQYLAVSVGRHLLPKEKAPRRGLHLAILRPSRRILRQELHTEPIRVAGATCRRTGYYHRSPLQPGFGFFVTSQALRPVSLWYS